MTPLVYHSIQGGYPSLRVCNANAQGVRVGNFVGGSSFCDTFWRFGSKGNQREARHFTSLGVYQAIGQLARRLSVGGG